MPSRRIVTREVGGVSERWKDGFLLRNGLPVLANFLLAGHDAVEIIFVGVDVFKIKFVDFGYRLSSWWNKAAFDDKRYEGAGDNVLLAWNLEERLLDLEKW